MTQPSDAPPPPITNFENLIAVVTGGGSGMGRELTRLLGAAGCSVAICDVDPDGMNGTLAAARSAADAAGFGSARFASAVTDVADADQMHRFAAQVADEFDTDYINLLFNNAGIGGAGSFLTSSDQQWDRVFGVCWGGVLNGCRAFRPMLVAAERGQVVNTSSVNGMWACLGPTGPHTAYSAAKFAVKGFTEALIVDFRVNAPHLTAAVVVPGHIGTAIMRNSFRLQGHEPESLTADQIERLRHDFAKRGLNVSTTSDDDIRALLQMRVDGFEQHAPMTAAEAAATILDGVTRGDWRILIGDDADALDDALRASPHDAYSFAFTAALSQAGHFGGLILG